LFSLIWHCGFLNALCDAENREKPTTQNLRIRAIMALNNYTSDLKPLFSRRWIKPSTIDVAILHYPPV
jgi:hypothetical protein